MLLNSLILLVVIFTTNIYILGLIFSFYLIKFIITKEIKEFFNLRVYLPIVIFSSIIQLFYNQSGKVIIKYGFLLITDIGINSASTTVLKIMTMVLISKESDFSILLKGPLKKYSIIFRNCIKLVPEIIKMPKEIVKPGKILKVILRKSYREIKENYHTNSLK